MSHEKASESVSTKSIFFMDFVDTDSRISQVQKLSRFRKVLSTMRNKLEERVLLAVPINGCHQEHGLADPGSLCRSTVQSYIARILLDPESLKIHKKRIERFADDATMAAVRFSGYRLNSNSIRRVVNMGLETLSDRELVVLLWDLPILEKIAHELNLFAEEDADTFFDCWCMVHDDRPLDEMPNINDSEAEISDGVSQRKDVRSPTIPEYRNAFDASLVRERIDNSAFRHLQALDSVSRNRLVLTLRMIVEKMRRETIPSDFLDLDVEFHVAIARIVGKDHEMREACEFIHRFGATNGRDATQRALVSLEHEMIINAIVCGNFDEAIERANSHRLHAVRRWFLNFEKKVFEHNMRLTREIPDNHNVVVVATNTAPLEFEDKYRAKYTDVIADVIARGVKYVFIAPSSELIERWNETVKSHEVAFDISPDVTMDRLNQFREGVARSLAKSEEAKKTITDEEERKAIYAKAIQKTQDALVLHFSDSDRPFDRAGFNQTVGLILDAQWHVVAINHRHVRDDFGAHPMIENDLATPVGKLHWESIIHGEIFVTVR